MKTQIPIMMIVMSLFGLSPAWGSSESPQERIDRSSYNQLIAEVRKIDAEYAQLVDQGMTEARDNDGQASLETQSRIVGLRDKRDRRMNRLLSIALRWGWAVPDINASTEPPTKPVLSEKKLLFMHADHAIKTRFAEESRVIARAITLPVITINRPDTQLSKKETKR